MILFFFNFIIIVCVCVCVCGDDRFVKMLWFTEDYVEHYWFITDKTDKRRCNHLHVYDSTQTHTPYNTRSVNVH
jgi:hypothetical protein